MSTGLLPVELDAPLATPSPGGLFPAVTWVGDGETPRWLDSGLQLRTFNFLDGDEPAFGVWTADICDPDPDDEKLGARPADPEPFDPVTLWASDGCDLTEASQDKVRTLAQQNLQLNAPVAVEAHLATRLLADAGTPTEATNIVTAIGALEAALAVTNTLGVIHAATRFAGPLTAANLVRRDGGALKSPLGHTFVFGGGYADLGDVLVATSPVFGRRTAAVLRDVTTLKYNPFTAVAEQSFVLGYERFIAAAEVATP